MSGRIPAARGEPRAFHFLIGEGRLACGRTGTAAVFSDRRSHFCKTCRRVLDKKKQGWKPMFRNGEWQLEKWPTTWSMTTSLNTPNSVVSYTNTNTNTMALSWWVAA